MRNILKLEFIKTLGYPGFRTIVILHAVLFLLVVVIGSRVNLQFQGIKLDILVSFPYVWETLSWIGSWFNILLGILAIILVGNEFQFRTFRKQIIDGVSRNQLLNAKMIVMATLSIYALVLVLLSSFLLGFVYSDSITISSVFEKSPFVFVLFIQSFAYMMLGMLFALVLKNNAISIVTFILFFFPGEPILRAFFPDSIDRFFPIKIISNLTPMPDFLGITSKQLIQINGKSPSFQSMGLMPENLNVWFAALVCLAYIGLFYLLSKYVIERKNF
ncbi:MAG TPA: hypothetical protein DIW31_07095 [Bacteroidales bacterium]|nr:hypothetical protein [Bacteroidales bacterium]